MPSDRNLNHLYPPFRDKVVAALRAINDYAKKHMQGFEWVIVEGFRTAAYQNSLYQKGRSKPGSIVTNCDGYKHESNHQSSLAVDIAPKTGGKIVWDVDHKHWEHLGHCYRAQGIAWGGDWPKLRDMPHGEIPKTDKKTHAAARKWQKEVGLR